MILFYNKPVSEITLELRGNFRGSVSITSGLPANDGLDGSGEARCSQNATDAGNILQYGSAAITLDTDVWKIVSIPVSIAPTGKTALYITFSGEGEADFSRLTFI